MLAITIEADFVAIYAAIVSTFVLVIQFLNYRNERVNVSMEYKTNYQIHGDNFYDLEKTYLVLTVRNKGKRSITIQNVGYIAKKGNNGIIIDSILFGSSAFSLRIPLA